MKTYKNLLSSALLLIFLTFATSCGGDKKDMDWNWGDSPENPEQPVDPTPEPEADPNQYILDAGWTNVTTLGTLPSYIKVFKAPTQLENKNAVAYIAVADMSKATFNVIGKDGESKTPSQFYEQDNAPIIINGGYFYWDDTNGKMVTASMICRNGVVENPNIQYDGRDNWQTLYYPTRSIFSMSKNKKFTAEWCYTTTGNITYTYPQPAANKTGNKPLNAPSSNFPEGGSRFTGQTAIGGGPLLLKGGEVKNTYWEEMFDEGGVGPTSNNPRTAIGITADNRMILFVCEGRNMTSNVPGYTTEEVAKIMKSLACVDALNLDGGGSSCMLVNGKSTIKVSDGNERSVVTGVALK